ncbi:DUF6221 family protein [Streptomyces rubiginosohelvolus]|uniref:DUF6221 family protein n=1 Tax=Streptomyces rubiginosohelvolus TaxID=67362 RepID=UPI0036674764
MTDALVAFVKARLDDDERVACAARDDVGEAEWIGSQESGHPWRYQHQGVWGEHDGLCSEAPPVAETASRPVQDHIARHDPARTLREIEAKRQLLDEHQDVNDGSCGTCVDGKWGYPTHGGSSPQSYPCRTLRLLALPYSGHPEYKEAWRP